jgi:hypothetical protein
MRLAAVGTGSEPPSRRRGAKLLVGGAAPEPEAGTLRDKSCEQKAHWLDQKASDDWEVFDSKKDYGRNNTAD